MYNNQIFFIAACVQYPRGHTSCPRDPCRVIVYTVQYGGENRHAGGEGEGGAGAAAAAGGGGGPLLLRQHGRRVCDPVQGLPQAHCPGLLHLSYQEGAQRAHPGVRGKDFPQEDLSQVPASHQSITV